MFTGSCLYGGVQYRVDAAPEPIQICCCQQCRHPEDGEMWEWRIPAGRNLDRLSTEVLRDR